MAKPTFTVNGSVLSRLNGFGLRDFAVEAWDKDDRIKEPLGRATTDKSGAFELTLDARYYKEICEERKPDVYFRILSGDRLIESTENSVLWNVEQWPLQVTISVGLLPGRKRSRKRPTSFTVRGRVAKPDGSPAPRLRIVALEKEPNSTETQGGRVLGTTKTDAAGLYAIRYSADQLRNPAKGSADLVVRAYAEKAAEPLASSPLILNALEEEIVNLSVGEQPYRGRAEYDVVAQRVGPFLDRSSKTGVSDQDLVHISSQAGLTPEQVQLYVESQTQSGKAEVPASILYALYRTGMPHSLAALTVQNPEVLHAALNRAQAKNIIARLDEATAAKAVEALQALSSRELLATDSPARVQAAKLFDLVALSADERVVVLKVYAATRDQARNFWDDLQATKRLDEAKVGALRRVFELNALGLGHLPLVEKLAAHQELTSLKDLASKSAKEWTAFLEEEGIAAPDKVTGKSPADKRSNYALILARLVEDAFPTASFASGWIRDASLDKDVGSFFARNTGFAFEEKGVNTYLKERPTALDAVPDKAAATLKLQAVQNLFRISPRFERLSAVRTLWKDKLHSAYAVKRIGQGKFVAKYGKTLGSRQAAVIYAKAEKVAGFSLLALAKYAWDTNSVTPYVIPKTDLRVNPNEHARATLAEIFGNLDFCHCEHCRSVLGPPAYLVDLLMFLDNATAADGDTGLEKLFARRRDIGNIKLNCENTKTLLPYLDLVNEVLEDTIVPRPYVPETHGGTTVFVGEVSQTDEMHAEVLRAHPEHLNADAYEIVKDAAYPWSLPFNLWAEEARAYLAQLGVRRRELMEVFSGPGAPSPTELEVLCDAVGLIPRDRSLLTTTVINAAQLRDLWGVKSGLLITRVSKASVFLDRAGIDYAQLEALLQCRVVNPPGADDGIQISFDENYPCSLADATLTNLTLAKLDQLHRLIRLRNRLSWTFFDLDRALTAFVSTAIDEDFLGTLSLTIQLKEALGVDLLTALSWWSARLDTTDYKDTPSQYAELFQRRAIGELGSDIVLETLTLNDSRDELAAVNQRMIAPEYEPVVLSAANITKDDLTSIITEDLAGVDTLNLAGISHVFRVASFTRAIRLSVNEYYLLKKLSGVSPLSAPGRTAAPRDTKSFLDVKEHIAASGIGLAELGYLLAHDSRQPNSGGLLDDVLAQRLEAIRADLTAVRAAHQMPAEGRETGLAQKLGHVIEEADLHNAALQIVVGQSPSSNADQKQFIDDHFALFLDAADAKDQLVGPVNALGDDVQARLGYVLEPLLAYLYPRQIQRALAQKLAESLSIGVATAGALLEVVTNPLDGNQAARNVLQDEAFVTGTDPVGPLTYPSQCATYERVFKASRLLSGLSIGPDDQTFVVRHGAAIGWPDVNGLPSVLLASGPALTEQVERFIAMVKALQVWPRIRTSGAPLTQFLSEARGPDLTEAQIRERLAGHTAWALEDIETLTANYGLGLADLRKADWLVKLFKAFTILRRLGVRAAQAWSWNTAETTVEQATQIKLAARARYDTREWLEVARALRDPLRETQRDALVAYVIHDQDFADADEAYGHLLIDTQMSACMETTRIRQAIASVQLFVQRILMNLESDEIEFSHAEATQWKWRKNYRVWEANRKVFLWPENWIYPDLRDDKSPFFRDLEAEIQQSDIDHASAERALMSYLKKVDEVAHLEVSGLFEEIDDETDLNVLHVIARTRSKPYRYFYRRWMNKQFWTAWERVDADIEGDHLIPVVHNRRLFLFWPKFVEKAVVPQGSDMTDVRDAENEPDDPLKYYEIPIAWTQYRDGKWRETQVSTDSFSDRHGATAQLRPKEDFYFYADQTSIDGLLLRCRLVPTEDDQFWVGQMLQYSDVTDSLEYRGNKGVTDVDVLALGFLGGYRDYTLNKLPNGGNTFMEFEKTEKPTELRLLTYADVDFLGIVNPSTEQEATLLTAARDGFELMLPHQYPTYVSQSPFFYSDGRRVLFVEPRDEYWNLAVNPFGNAIDIPEDSYVPDIKVTMRGYSMTDVGEGGFPAGPGMKGDRPFFDDERPFYAGNKRAGLVIDRGGAGTPAESPVEAGTLIVDDPNADRPTDIDESFFDSIELGIDRRDLYGGLWGMGWRWGGKRYRFRSFYHPYVPLMIRQLNRYGVEGLLGPTALHGSRWRELKRQAADHDYFATYSPDPAVVDGPDEYPRDEFDFSFGGAYSQYNWELFFHVPLLIAERLTQNQKFEAAQQWFHYVFDPTETEGPAPKRFWNFKAFHDYNDETTIEGLLELLNEGDSDVEAQVERWENDPFNPHLVARMRTVAYMRATVMKYLDNLIAWGDSLFRQDTMESTNEATQIYVLAAQILGRKPERIGKVEVSPYTFNTLFPLLDEFANARVRVESFLPWMTSHRSDPPSGASGVLDTLYFCIPQNEKLFEYWNTVADRLFKLRHCMNIEGVRRQLVPFDPPIDPGLLVKARAAGMDLSSILADLGAPLPYQRFRVMLQRANEFCAEVRALGSSLLQGLERRDEAELAAIRATHQVDLLMALRETKVKAKDEADKQKEALTKRQQSADIRKKHYQRLAFMSPLETTAQTLYEAALIPHVIGTIGEVISAVFAMMPSYQIGMSGFGGSPHVTVVWGSDNIAGSSAHMNSHFFQLSALLTNTGSIINTLAGYQRRHEEWDLQIALATKEWEELDRQLLAAQARVDLAVAEVRAHEKQITYAESEAAYLESRFTNKDLYNWMATQLSTLYFQTYQIAYDLARKAEQCFRHELAIPDSSYIQFGYWDSLKKGLLAGERLQMDLRRLEAAYLEMNRREFELTKHVSLSQLNPVALLQFTQTGRCEFAIPEVIFDLDHAGHYMRRIKAVSLTIPCVAGPYTSVAAKLTLLDNCVRTSTSTTGGYRYTGLDDPHFVHDLVGVQSIATSSGQQDAGLFELSFGDERYLPFEGAGVVSGWRLELPGDYRQFDYDTISDVILHLQYTARDGGDTFKTAVQDDLRASLNRIADVLADAETGLTRVISAAHEFGADWYRFMFPSQDASVQDLRLKLDKRLFPFMLKERRLNIPKITVILILENATLYGAGELGVTITLPDDSEHADRLTLSERHGGQPALILATDLTFEADPLDIAVRVDEASLAAIAPDLVVERDGRSRLSSDEVKDLLIAVNYTITG